MRKFLIAVAISTGFLGTYLSYDAIVSSARTLMESSMSLILLIIFAVVLQLCGHILRAKRTKLITDQAAKSSTQFQFATLSIGYLFNTLLPFRVGELVRAVLIARRLRISLLYTFTSVVIERAVDVLFLGSLIVVGALLVGGNVATQIAIFTVSVMILAILVLVVLGLLMRENRQILSVIWRITNWFNASISNSLRFKVWSLIFGLQHFFQNHSLTRSYVAFAAGSWVLYAASALLIATAVLQNITAVEAFIASLAPYVISLPTWNILDADNYGQLVSLLPSQTIENISTYGLLTWTVLVFPMAVIGVGSLLIYRVEPRRRGQGASPASFANKLLRHEDISQEFPAFLDSYFSGNSLAKILHRLEAANDLRLVKFFKGGSDAITILVLGENELFVKKIIPIEYEDRLKAQYEWLNKHNKLKHLVKVLGEQKTNDYYAIDLDYDPENIPLFEYIHHNSITQSKEIVEKTWKSLYNHLYRGVGNPKLDEAARDAFIEKHMYGCVDKASETSSDLVRALEPSKITINGKEYDNFYQIMDRIKSHKQAWKDIATFAHSSEVHGDMAIDNVLVSPRTGKPVIIDPAPDGNIINGPVFDLGKMSQSFYCGYEFLFRDNEAVWLSGKSDINYRDHMSDRYARLWDYLHDELAPKYLSQSEIHSMMFHAAALHIRVLKHRVYINPDNVLKFYAVGVKTLNDFLDQYDK